MIWTGKMAQWVKTLPHEHKDLSSELHGKAEIGRSLELPLTGYLAQPIREPRVQWATLSQVKKKKKKKEEKRKERRKGGGKEGGEKSLRFYFVGAAKKTLAQGTNDELEEGKQGPRMTVNLLWFLLVPIE